MHRRWSFVLVMMFAASCEQECKQSERSNCCKVCTTGKPCGDTCIEETDTCHQVGGCACAK
ncbi:MAG TPA: hypothetical protein VFV99_10005 [Kofleriaceae bacterium]|nr:hypothetical protein [Kofleriaceae bacterium]